MDNKHFSEKKISNNKYRENKTISNLETFYNKTLNNYTNSFSPFFNKALYFKLKINNKEKNNQIFNNIKIDNDNSIKNKTISIRKFKSFENEKDIKIGENRINCYKNKINKKKNYKLNRLNIDNNKKKNLEFLRLKQKYNSPTFSYNNKRGLIKKKSNKHFKTENKNQENQREFIGDQNHSNSIYHNLLSHFKTPSINNNTSRNNNSILENKENNNIIENIEFEISNNMIDLEPFDLNCFFYLPKKVIKTKILNKLEILKWKIKQINPNKYIIYFDENENIYEFNLPKNYSGIIKFKKIKGINKIYINYIRSLISKSLEKSNII
jgi:hypothetical protein